MRLIVFHKNWQPGNCDTQVCLALYKLAAANHDIRIITTSHNGVGTIEGGKGIVVERVESTPGRVDGVFINNSLDCLRKRKADVILNINNAAQIPFKLTIPIVTLWHNLTACEFQDVFKYSKFYDEHIVCSSSDADILIKHITPNTAVHRLDYISSDNIEPILLNAMKLARYKG
jgi:hypothetical protein